MRIKLWPLFWSRGYSTARPGVRVGAVLDEEVEKMLSDNLTKVRRHPGTVAMPSVTLPADLRTAISRVVAGTPTKQLAEESAKLERYLRSRLLPVEIHEMHKKWSTVTSKISQQMRHLDEGATEEDLEGYRRELKGRAEKVMKEQLYSWKPLDLSTKHKCLVYLSGASAAEYACVTSVFRYLMAKIPDFAPTSLFDFGSGVGTVSWSAQEFWGDTLKEYYCVDSSMEMNNLAKNILETMNNERSKKILAKTFYRQFLPASNQRRYDVVVSSHSLLDLPSAESREQVVLNLWNKTDRCLVLVEEGTKPGFKVLNEAKNLILGFSNAKKYEPQNIGHVVAPCPHDELCPRISKSEHSSPCNFPILYFCSRHNKLTLQRRLFSYIILAKGEREPEKEEWARVVKKVLVRSRHAICDLCTPSAQLKRIIFTPTKHTKLTYRCARSTKWGDRLPVRLREDD